MERVFVVPYCCRVLGLIGLTVLMCCAWSVMAEEECKSDKNEDGSPVEYCKPCSPHDRDLLCYECDSLTDPSCADPFNYTLHPIDLPNREKCDGCCVKMVMMKGTKYESVRRTCTKHLLINLFMVDHVCMSESNEQGHMCFCEEELCNTAHRTYSFFYNYFSLPFLLLTHLLLLLFAPNYDFL
ncbi:hypothetical protein CHUAL_005092 [Chamberlinius hualienensis]